MNRNELLKKIQEYFERTITEPGKLRKYKPDEIGHWRVISGAIDSESNRREISEVLHGRFIDAVAWAVQEKEFYSTTLTLITNYSRYEHGIVKKVNIQELPDYQIPKSLVRDFDLQLNLMINPHKNL